MSKQKQYDAEYKRQTVEYILDKESQWHKSIGN